jgi:hypothetical protein
MEYSVLTESRQVMLAFTSVVLPMRSGKIPRLSNSTSFVSVPFDKSIPKIMS